MSEMAALRDLVELRGEKISSAKDSRLPYIGLEHVAQNTGAIIGSAPSTTSVSINSTFASGDILFGKLRPNLRKCAQAMFAGYCSTDLLVLRARALTDPGFAARTLQSEKVFTEALRTAEGTKMPRTSWPALQHLEVFNPPFPQQRRIAEILDTVDEAIRSTESLIEKLDRVKQGLLHDLLTRGIDESGQCRDPNRHPEQFHSTSVGVLPRKWRLLPLPGIVHYQNGGTFPSTDYCDNGIPLLRPGNLSHSEIVSWDPTHTTFLPPNWESAGAAFLVGEGEVVMNLTAQSLEEGFLGRACLTGPGTRCLLNQRIARFRPLGISPEFLLWFFRGPVFRSQIDPSATGSKVQHLYNGDLDSVLVPVPPDVEAREVSAILWRAFERRESEVSELTKLRQLKSGLMEDLLTGRVRVNADEDAA